MLNLIRGLQRLCCVALLLVTNIAAASNVDPIVIGGSLGLTGKYEKLGMMQLKGYKLWQKQINQQGGLLGREVQLQILDDQSSPQRATEIYSELLQGQPVDLLFAPYSSSLTNAIMPIVESHGVPLIASGAAADQLWEQGYKNLFGLFIPASRYAVGFLEMVALQGYQKLAIVAADDLFSKAIAAGTKQWAESFGLEVVVNKSFVKGGHDLTAEAEAVKQSGAEILVVCGHYNESIDMAKALNRVEFKPKAHFATIGPALEKYQQELGLLSEEVFSSMQWNSRAMHRQADVERFLQPFVEEYGVDPSYHAAQAYAAGEVLAAAVKVNRSLEHAALRNTLANFHTMSIIGRYGVDASGRQIGHFAINSQWQNGQLEVVWPDELATAPAILHP